MLVIEIAKSKDGTHRSQSGSFKCTPAGWVNVPPHLESETLSKLPFISLTIENGVLVGIVPTERPELEEPGPPTPDGQMRADIDFIAAMTGVSL